MTPAAEIIPATPHPYAGVVEGPFPRSVSGYFSSLAAVDLEYPFPNREKNLNFFGVFHSWRTHPMVDSVDGGDGVVESDGRH
jgi:hypothetical protein